MSSRSPRTIRRPSGASRLAQALLFLFGAVALAVPACSTDDPPKPALSCSQNSDCKQPYICAIGRCRDVCHTSADCEGGGSCVTDETGKPVCQPPEEKNTACNFQEDCTKPLACASDYRCRNMCLTDAHCNPPGVSGRSCVEDANGVKFCADPAETEDGKLTVEPAPKHREDPVEAAPKNIEDYLPPQNSPADGIGGGGAGNTPEPIGGGGSGAEGAAGPGEPGGGGAETTDGKGGTGNPSPGLGEQVGASDEDCPEPASTEAAASTIPEDTEWEGVHVVTGTVYVRAALKLKPCAQVRFGSGANLMVDSGGSLKAIGTKGKAVKFTSNKDAPKAGDWGRITIQDSASNDSRFEHSIVEYGGTEVLLVNDGASASFSSVSARDSSGGISLHPGVAVDEFENVRIERIAGYGLGTQFEGVRAIGSVSIIDAKNPGIWVGNYTQLTTPATWKNHGVPYAFVDTYSSTYYIQAALTLEAGVTVQVTGKTISVEKGGTLLTTGTKEQPVTFTSANATPKAGDWGALKFVGSASANSLLQHTIIEFAGGEAAIEPREDSVVGLSDVLIRRVAATGIGGWPRAHFSQFENVRVEEATKNPLAIQASMIGDLGSFSAADCNPNQIFVGNYDDITQPATWKNFDLPYALVDTYTSNYDVLAPVTLEEGTALLLAGGKNIAVGAGGSLKAEGTEDKPITITSSLASPEPGAWGRITVAKEANADSKLAHTTVSYGSSGALTLNGSKIELDHVTFEHNPTCDVDVKAGTLTEAGGNTFEQCE